METDTRTSMLQPIAGQPSTFAAQSVGFTSDGVADDLTADTEKQSIGGANSVDTGSTSGKTSRTTSPGTGSGKSPAVRPGPADPGDGQLHHRREETRELHLALVPAGPQDRRGPLLVVTAAGRILSYDAAACRTTASGCRCSTAPSADGAEGRRRRRHHPDGHRAVAVVAQPAGAAVADPRRRRRRAHRRQSRRPEHRPMGRGDPAARADRCGRCSPISARRRRCCWTGMSGWPFRVCVRSATGTGSRRYPQYRVLPDRIGADVSNAWQDSIGGGPLGWTGLLLDAQTMPDLPGQRLAAGLGFAGALHRAGPARATRHDRRRCADTLGCRRGPAYPGEVVNRSSSP